MASQSKITSQFEITSQSKITSQFEITSQSKIIEAKMKKEFFNKKNI